MPFQLSFDDYGVVKTFSELVTSGELLESERAIANHRDFKSIRYVVSHYLSATEFCSSQEEIKDLRTLRMLMHRNNPRIKYAFVTHNAEIRANVLQSVDAREMLYPVQIFDDLESAVVWALTS